MKTLYVMAGVPGCGKSTIANRIILGMGDHGDRVFVYSTDNLIEEWSSSQGWSYNFGFSKYISKATQHMDSELLMSLSESRDIVWDQTNLSIKKRRAILSRIPKDYRTECHAIQMPRGDSQTEDWNFRLDSRTGKNIPTAVIENMIKSYTLPTVSEGFDFVKLYDIYGNEVNYEQ